ncbi:DUF1266 domain-containing protein [Streptomyces sp. NPDC018833]|uniref:DUF1266 domain-containing protein n=1 Tax=Streptomyces sp. NPDC018833 TaxID=3365053 RepID=UPI0037A272F0
MAWDYGRAVSMARWGVAARFGDVPEPERSVLRAGEATRVTYRSWADCGAGSCWTGASTSTRRSWTRDTPRSPRPTIPDHQPRKPLAHDPVAIAAPRG